jgi:hypothetical protein
VPTALTAQFCENDQHLRQWSAFARRIGENDLATDFARVIVDLVVFLIPPVKSATADKVYTAYWSSKLGAWQSGKQRMPHAPVDER